MPVHARFRRPPQPPTSPECGAWDEVRAGWSQVYGSFERLGVSVEMHDFHTEAALDWGRSFHPESVELCLNLAGRGEVARGRDSIALPSGAAAAYAQAGEPLRARREAGERHRFVTVEFSRAFLARHLAGVEAQAAPVVQRSVFARRVASAVGESNTLNEELRGFLPESVAPKAQESLAPKAQLHTSLGQRPSPRAKGAASYQPGATPQEFRWRRMSAESAIHLAR